MKKMHYTKTHKLNALHEQLLAAGIAPERVEGLSDDIWLTLSDTIDEAAVQVVVDAHDPTADSASEALQRKILTLAKSAEGIMLGDLTAAQVKALLAVVLWKQGGLDKGLVVRPLREWA